MCEVVVPCPLCGCPSLQYYYCVGFMMSLSLHVSRRNETILYSWMTSPGYKVWHCIILLNNLRMHAEVLFFVNFDAHSAKWSRSCPSYAYVRMYETVISVGEFYLTNNIMCSFICKKESFHLDVIRLTNFLPFKDTFLFWKRNFDEKQKKIAWVKVKIFISLRTHTRLLSFVFLSLGSTLRRHVKP